MTTVDQMFRRNFTAAAIVHVMLIAGIVLFEAIASHARRTPGPVEVMIMPDILGDRPQGPGFGRGVFTAPAPAPPESLPAGEQIVTPEERIVTQPRPQAVAQPRPEPNAVTVPTTRRTTPPRPPATTPQARTSTMTTARTTASNTAANTAAVRNRFADALRSAGGGTPYGDNQRAGGGSGRSSVIGSRDGSEHGVIGGNGAGTPFAWYYKDVHDRMYEAWLQPPDAVNWDKRAISTIVIKVARNGEVVAVRLATGSGIAAMDESVMAAARNVPRLQPLPDGLGGATFDITVNFQKEG